MVNLLLIIMHLLVQRDGKGDQMKRKSKYHLQNFPPVFLPFPPLLPFPFSHPLATQRRSRFLRSWVCFRAAMHSWHTKTPHSISSALRKAAFLGRSSLRICNLRDAILKAAPGFSYVSVFCSNDPDGTRITGHSFGRLYGLRDLSTNIMLEYMYIRERERGGKREREREKACH